MHLLFSNNSYLFTIIIQTEKDKEKKLKLFGVKMRYAFSIRSRERLRSVFLTCHSIQLINAVLSIPYDLTGFVTSDD